MKRFIRLTNGKIYEIAKDYRAVNGSGYVVAPECKYYLDKKKFINIIAESDNILDLIDMVFANDNVDYQLFDLKHYQHSDNEPIRYTLLKYFKHYKSIMGFVETENGDIKQVCFVNDKGEWEVL